MRRTISIDYFIKGKDIHKALRKFEKKFPFLKDFTCFDIDMSTEEVLASLPMTDRDLGDGTKNHDWTYYFDIDVTDVDDGDGFYIWYVERG